jgi:hypothetical protein
MRWRLPRYIEKIGGEMAKPSVNQQLAAIRHMRDYLVTGRILSIKSAASCPWVQIRGATRQDPSAIGRPGPSAAGHYRTSATT